MDTSLFQYYHDLGVRGLKVDLNSLWNNDEMFFTNFTFLRGFMIGYKSLKGVHLKNSGRVVWIVFDKLILEIAKFF